MRFNYFGCDHSVTNPPVLFYLTRPTRTVSESAQDQPESGPLPPLRLAAAAQSSATWVSVTAGPGRTNPADFLTRERLLHHRSGIPYKLLAEQLLLILLYFSFQHLFGFILLHLQRWAHAAFLDGYAATGAASSCGLLGSL